MLFRSTGGLRYPLTTSVRRSIWGLKPGEKGAVSTSLKEGGDQMEYEDQDPRIHRKFLRALKENGVTSLMGDILDEEALMKLSEDSLAGPIRTPELKGPAI